jgi:hypothetical protein
VARALSTAGGSGVGPSTILLPYAGGGATSGFGRGRSAGPRV